jgi:hypothetical protein
VEEKDMNQEKDVHTEAEDTEAHVQQANLEPDEAVNARQDEGEDVEGHLNQGVNTAADAVQVGREDEGDDVEGHLNQ